MSDLSKPLSHVDAAKSLIRTAGNRTPDVAAVLVATAQVHATLALAEQQSIANLTAYVAVLEAQYASAAKHGGFDEATRAASYARHEEAQERIRAGLGLS
jgi:hypothetical protein